MSTATMRKTGERMSRPGRRRHVHRPLDDALAASEGHIVDRDNGEAVEVLDVGFRVRSWNRSGMSRTLTTYLVDDLDCLQDLGVVVRGPGQRRPRDSPFLHHGAEVLERAEHPDAAVDFDLLAQPSLVVQEALDPETQVLVQVGASGPPPSPFRPRRR